MANPDGVMRASAIEDAYMNLHNISVGWRNPTQREYYVAVIDDVDRVTKFCFFSEKVEDRVKGFRITSRKRYILRAIDVLHGMRDESKEDEHTKLVLREAKEQIYELLRRRIAPLWLPISNLGSMAAYRVLCKMAEQRGQ